MNRRNLLKYSVAMIAGPALFAAVLTLSGCGLQPRGIAPPRERILFDADWRFQTVPEVELANAHSIVDWRVKAASQGGGDLANAAANVSTTGADWRDAKTGQETFNRQAGSQWFRTVLPEVRGPHRVVRFHAVNDNATVFLNGRQLIQHQGYEDPFEVPLDEAWVAGGPNVLAVLVENIGGAGGITGAVTEGELPPPPSEASERTVEFNDRSWRTVHLPHDYVVEGTFTSTGPVSHGSLPTPQA